MAVILTNPYGYDILPKIFTHKYFQQIGAVAGDWCQYCTHWNSFYFELFLFFWLFHVFVSFCRFSVCAAKFPAINFFLIPRSRGPLGEEHTLLFLVIYSILYFLV